MKRGQLVVHSDLVQGSQDWFDARCGLITASAVGRLLTTDSAPPTAVGCDECGVPAGSPCISRARKAAADPLPIKTFHPDRTRDATYLPSRLVTADNDTSRGLTLTLAAERITGHVEETPTTSAMMRGHIEEPLARDAYSQHYAPVEQCGFMVREFDGIKVGYSPDGLVGTDGLIEIKSRGQKTQVHTVLADEVPAANYAQLQCGLLVSGRDWCDYVSFSGGMALWTKRVYPDPAWHDAILAAAVAFEAAVSDITARYHAAVVGLPMTERTPDPFLEPVI